ncbi:MAG: hypothetical protein F4114_17635 [Rhodospirillaceae bacterium]|nr:hypothetical protein [Rhodospirillaceae bacterium]MYB13380.1 hypothetical protein [Rhodospirillaceae bacterium]MYI50891.1 hypothetical protein [Rhodospirillaceae bacterium]
MREALSLPVTRLRLTAAVVGDGAGAATAVGVAAGSDAGSVERFGPAVVRVADFIVAARAIPACVCADSA